MGATRKIALLVTVASVCVGSAAAPATASIRNRVGSGDLGSGAGSTDRVMVGIRRAERPDALEAIHEAGGQVVDYSRTGGFLVVETPPDVAQWTERVEDDEAVRYIEPDWKLSAADLVAPDPRLRDLWGLKRIASPAASPGAGGAEVVVAVIDSGIDYTHEDLADQMWINPGEDPSTPGDDDGNGWSNDIYGIDCANDDADPMDDNGHGTHVAGTIAATPSNGKGVLGVASNVKVMALKILGADGTGYTSDAIQCLDYALAQGAHITNNSWGGPDFSQNLQDAIAIAGAKNQLFVAAAGNVGSDNDPKPHYPASYGLDNVISVAASDRDDRLAGFSNYGAASVDLAAPGVGILSTVPGGYAFYSGTSMATPHVSGAAAVLAGADPALAADASALRAALLGLVEPLPALQGAVATGGRLDLAGLEVSVPSAMNPSEPAECTRRTSRRACPRRG